MATASEIKVTEAYIGLLGRAPDPAGLAYWTAELDAAGGSDDALKKLSNDITRSAEWDAGLGANVTKTTVDGVTTLSYTKVQADAVVNGMYKNLFNKEGATAPSDADVKYWSDQLQDGTVTASEMSVLLILGAGTTDKEVLAYKQEAATYYVENIAAEDFSGDVTTGRAQATTAVDAVEGPVTLAVSKAATDAIATGTGNSKALTTADDTIVMTGGDDVVTGTNLTSGAGDSLADKSASDSDSLTITATGDVTLGTVTNVEAVSISMEKVQGTAFEIVSTNLTGAGSTLTVETASTTSIGGANVAAETGIEINKLAVDLSTSKVTDVLIDATSNDSVTVTGDSKLAALTVTGATATNDSFTAVFANNDADLTYTGGGGAADALSVTAGGNLDLSATTVETVSITGASEALTVDVSGGGTAMDFNVAGDQNVTIEAAGGVFTGKTLTDTSTAGTTSISVEGAGADLTGFGALSGGITLANNAANDITLQSGNTVTYKGANPASTLTANDAATVTNSTVDIVIDGPTNAAGTITEAGFETINVTTNDSASNHNIGLVLTNDTSVTLTAGNDIADFHVASTGLTTDKGLVSVVANVTGSLTTGAGTANSLVNQATDGAATLSLTSTKDLTASGNTITVTANDGDATVNLVSTTGDVVTGAIAVDSTAEGGDTSVTVVAVNDITVATLTQSGGANGEITLTAGNELTVTNAFDDQKTTNGTDINLTATANDVNVAAIDSNDGDITIKAGETLQGSGAIDAGTGALSITVGAAGTSAAGALTAASVAITAGNDITLGDITTAAVVGSGAGDITANDITANVVNMTQSTGGISATFNDNPGSGEIDIIGGAGNDTLILNDNEVDFQVTTGLGVDTVTVTISKTGSKVDTGAGADTVNQNDTTGGVLTIETGGGDDAILVKAAVANDVINAGADNDTITLAGDVGDGSTLSVNGGDGTGDKLVLAAVDYTANTQSLAFTGIEVVAVTAGDATISAAAFANDNVFALMGDNDTDELIIKAASTGSTIDATDVTFDTENLANVGFSLGAGDDVVTGSVRGDTISGSGGNDTLNGDAGADIITGGAGADIINGGTGADVIVFSGDTDGAANDASDALTVETVGADAITFVAADDAIGLATDFRAASLTGAANDDAAPIVYGAGIDMNTALTGTDSTFLVAAKAGGSGATATASDLLTIADLNAAIGTLANDDIGDERIIAFNAEDGTSVLYKFTSFANDGAITADELQLLGVFDSALADADITFV